MNALRSLFQAKALISMCQPGSAFNKYKFLFTGFLCALLSSCGGGGSGSGGSNNNFTPTSINSSLSASSISSSSASSVGAWQLGVYKSASNFANKCAVPRSGIDPSTNAAFLDTQGTTTDENNFLRSWSNDTYLWYKELPDVDPASYTDPLSYFDLLKTSAITASGAKKDKFHFTYTTSDWYAQSELGSSAGYGMSFSWISNTSPRNVVVAYTEPGSPAANASVLRGAKLIKVDGYDFVNGNDSVTVDKLNAGLFPTSVGESHSFELQDLGASSTHTVTLQSTTVTETPVQNVKVISTASGKVGYFLFNDHIATAEHELYDAFNQFSAQGVSDLVLDIRYNGGGYLYIASELAYMIAGSAATNGKTFEKTTFNDKYPTVDFFGDAITPTPFYNALSDTGAQLPSLNLSRVFVITSGDTCSASESIINSLRGINVQVIQIGAQTCGKPYGFYPQDNCGTTYFTIQFKGENNKGFGEYSDGFVPSITDNAMDHVQGCSLGDDFTHPLGDQAEQNLATALNYRATSSCSLPTLSTGIKLQKASNADDLSNASGSLHKSEGLMNRIIK